MADERKVFPAETVLALITGKNNEKAKNLASFLTGHTALTEEEARVIGPFAIAWLCRWQPKFSLLLPKEGENFEDFTTRARHVTGDNVSLAPMSGYLMDLVQTVLESLQESAKSVAAQTASVLSLEKEVKELRPAREKVKQLQKKCDDLEEKLKALKNDAGILQRKLAAYEGKMAVNEEELLENIKTAIKDGLKGVSVAAQLSGTASDTTETPQAENAQAVESEFGFGESMVNEDGFGF